MLVLITFLIALFPAQYSNAARSSEVARLELRALLQTTGSDAVYAEISSAASEAPCRKYRLTIVSENLRNERVVMSDCELGESHPKDASFLVDHIISAERKQLRCTLRMNRSVTTIYDFDNGLKQIYKSYTALTIVELRRNQFAGDRFEIVETISALQHTIHPSEDGWKLITGVNPIEPQYEFYRRTLIWDGKQFAPVPTTVSTRGPR